MRSWIKWYIYSKNLIVDSKVLCPMHNYMIWTFIYKKNTSTLLEVFVICTHRAMFYKQTILFTSASSGDRSSSSSTHRAWGNKVDTKKFVWISPCWRGKPFIESLMFNSYSCDIFWVERIVNISTLQSRNEISSIIVLSFKRHHGPWLGG